MTNSWRFPHSIATVHLLSNITAEVKVLEGSEVFDALGDVQEAMMAYHVVAQVQTCQRGGPALESACLH